MIQGRRSPLGSHRLAKPTPDVSADHRSARIKVEIRNPVIFRRRQTHRVAPEFIPGCCKHKRLVLCGWCFPAGVLQNLRWTMASCSLRSTRFENLGYPASNVKDMDRVHRCDVPHKSYLLQLYCRILDLPRSCDHYCSESRFVDKQCRARER